MLRLRRGPLLDKVVYAGGGAGMAVCGVWEVRGRAATATEPPLVGWSTVATLSMADRPNGP